MQIALRVEEIHLDCFPPYPPQPIPYHLPRWLGCVFKLALGVRSLPFIFHSVRYFFIVAKLPVK